MGKFRVIVAENAILDIQKHLKSGNKPTIKKIETILRELEIHPTFGTGQPERLKYDYSGKWSRRINQKTDSSTQSMTKRLPWKYFQQWGITTINK